MDFDVYNKYSIFNRKSDIILFYKHGHFIQFVLKKIVFTDKWLVQCAVNYIGKVIHLVKTFNLK